MLFIYIVNGCLCIIALLILFTMMFKNYAIEIANKKYFLFAIIIACFIILSELCVSYYELTGITLDNLYTIINLFGFSLSPFIPFFISLIFNKNKNKHTLLYVLILPSVLNVVMVLLSPKYGYIFKVIDNTYVRGDYFYLYIVAYISSMVYLLIKILLQIKQNQGESRYSLISLFLFNLTATTTQILYPHVHISWLCITFSLILLYAYFCELNEKEDVLTNLLNRRAYDYYLLKLQKSNKVLIIFFDIDNFKMLNDQYGHQHGDASLKIVANLIKENFALYGKCFRIGGDEFCVLIKYSDDLKMKRILKETLGNFNNLKQPEESMPSVSFGYSTYLRSDGDINKAVNKAGQQMYYNKEQKNKLHLM